MNIGNVEIPVIFNIEESNQAGVDEVNPLPQENNDMNPVAVKHETEVQSITIIGYLNEELHSAGKTIAEQKKSVKELRDNTVLDNSFTYRKYKGYMLIEDIRFPDNVDNSIVNEVIIEARYFPWPRYFTGKEP